MQTLTFLFPRCILYLDYHRHQKRAKRGPSVQYKFVLFLPGGYKVLKFNANI